MDPTGISPSTKFFAVAKNLSGHSLIISQACKIYYDFSRPDVSKTVCLLRVRARKIPQLKLEYFSTRGVILAFARTFFERE